ncbi:MAG TPA: DUF2797 domain-containing protein [Ktedonobacterales bacterium]|jgi:hypothetical protein
MPTEARTAGPYKPDQVGQKHRLPGARGAISDVFDPTAVRPSQHLIAYEWAPKPGAAAGAESQAKGNARLELLLRPWPLPAGMADPPLRRFPIEPGLNLLFRLHERLRLCVGYRDRATFKRLPCPQQGEELGSVERGPDYARVFQCSACAELEGVPEWLRHEAMPRWVGLETPSPAALEQAPYLSEPHVVYLAAFGPGRVKVGVAIERRVRLRFLEQGAHLGAVIARCPDGFAARRMERALCDLGLIDRVRAASKIRGLYPLLADDEAREEIDKTFHYVARHLKTEETSLLLPAPEVEDFRQFFRLQTLRAQPERLFPTVDVPIHGRVLATAGSCLVLERDGGRLWAVDIAGLRGALLSIARFQGGVISQMDLFGDFVGEQAG